MDDIDFDGLGIIHEEQNTNSDDNDNEVVIVVEDEDLSNQSHDESA